MNVEWMHSLYTVLAFVTFVVIAFWAWSARNRAGFEAAAQLPLLGDEGVVVHAAAAGESEK